MQDLCVLCLLLVTLLQLAAGTQTILSTGNGFDLGNALINQNVQAISLSQDVSLHEFAGVISALTGHGAAPYTIQRSLEISDAGGTPTLDAQYLPGRMSIAPGNSVTYKNVRVVRHEATALLGAFSNSPGAAVNFEHTVNVFEVCPPAAWAEAYLLHTVQRPTAGTNTGTFNDAAWVLNDVVLTIPQETATGLGGYTVSFTNSQVQCQSVVALPPECSDELAPGSISPAPLSSLCVAGMQRELRAMLCASKQCVHACRTACGVRHYVQARRRAYGRRH